MDRFPYQALADVLSTQPEEICADKWRGTEPEVMRRVPPAPPAGEFSALGDLTPVETFPPDKWRPLDPQRPPAKPRRPEGGYVDPTPFPILEAVSLDRWSPADPVIVRAPQLPPDSPLAFTELAISGTTLGVIALMRGALTRTRPIFER